MDFEAIEYANDNILISIGLSAKGDILALKRFVDSELNPSAYKGKERSREERKKRAV